jgi:hypothetical protein
MKANLKALAAALLAVCLGAQTGHAGPVGPLTTFTTGTTAKAAEANGNFSAVKTAVDDNHSRIGTLEGVNATSRLTTLETTVTPAGNIVLVPSTATAGNVLKGIAPFIHNFGTENTFIGVNAGNFTMTGNTNTAGGVNALSSNTTGGSNTASGVNALSSNTIGGSNTASGANALQLNTTGSNNTASGGIALFSNTTGSFNTASGVGALQRNTTGSQNTAIGANALFNNTTGLGNIAIGFGAGAFTTGGDNIAIGNLGVAAESSTIRIGANQTRTFIAGIRGVTTTTAAIAVVVGTDGQLGTLSSSRHVKDDIADMGEASSTLMKLRPVTFHYKTDKNPEGRALQYGLVAEEVAEVAPWLVARSADGEIETVFYQHLAPMLLNEYQKQQRTIQAQVAAFKQQTAALAKQTERVAALEQERRIQAARIEALERQAVRVASLLERVGQLDRVASVGR